MLKHAQKRVYITCLSMTRCPATNKFITEAVKAARRGVDVHVAIDLFAFLCGHNSKLRSRMLGRDMRRTSRMRNDFIDAGAEFHWLGMQRIPYFTGRTHSKWVIIDDDVFSFGGVNLDQSGITERVDYIFHLVDHNIADHIVAEQHFIEDHPDNAKRAKDHFVRTEYGDILFDSGRMGKSIIYNRAIKLAKRATSVVLCSQYCPGDKLSRVLVDKKAKVYFNPKGSAGDAANNFMIGSKKLTTEMPNQYKRARYLHAKFMIATLPDGSKRAVTGSNNFSSISIGAGTREVALETSDPRVIVQLEDFLDKYVA